MERKFYHQPVLLSTAVDFLLTGESGVYVDCTLGGAGHSEEILKRSGENVTLVCLDADPDAIAYARNRLAPYSNKIIRQVYYDQLDVVLVEEDLLPATGFLFDLGISSFQVDEKGRGFSYQAEGPLDMRFNPSQNLNGQVVVNEYPQEKLEEIFRNYGEERYWRRIARAVMEARAQSKIETTGQLKNIVEQVVGARFLNKSLARIFQAIRIEVNDELNRLKIALEKAFESQDEGGRIVAISYHSLEDRIVKEFFRYKELDCICPPEFPQCVCDKESEMRILTRKPVVPEEREITGNPRARSARLRVAEKIVPFRSVV